MSAARKTGMPEAATRAHRGALLAFLATHALERRGARDVSWSEKGDVLGWFGAWRVTVSTGCARPVAFARTYAVIELRDAGEMAHAWGEVLEALREIDAVINVVFPRREAEPEGFDVSTLASADRAAEL